MFRILVIEDDTPTRELLAEVLRKDGHAVIAEAGGLAGRSRALVQPFDLIISEVWLADLDGVQLAQQIRAAGIRTPLVALSRAATETERERSRAAGFDLYLSKPIKASALRALIAPLLLAPTAPTDLTGTIGPGVRSTAPLSLDAAVVERLHVPVPTLPRPRGVLGGLVVIAMGIPFILQPLGVPNAASYLFVAMGGAFLISYLRGHQYVYLIPMVTLTSFGIALLLPTWFTLRGEAVAPAFVSVIALGFFVAFGLAPQRRWPLVPAALLGFTALSRLFVGSSLIPAPLEPFLVPVVLIGVGLYLLIEPQAS